MYGKIMGALASLLALDESAQAQTTCAMPAIADQVALAPVANSNLMTVPVTINGKPKQFLLAISNNPTEVAQATVSELGLPRYSGASEDFLYQSTTAGGMGEQGPGYQGTLGAPTYDARSGGGTGALQTRVRAASFSIGTADTKNMQLLVADDKEMGKSKPYDGLMTGAFFKQYDVEMDFAGKKLTFLTANGCSDPNQVVFWPHGAIAEVPMSLSNGKVQVPVVIDGHTINAVIDTSLMRTVMRRDIAERTFGLQTGGLQTGSSMMEDSGPRDGGGQTVYVHTFPQIKLDGITASNVPVAIQVNSMVHVMDRQPITGSRAQFAADPRTRIPDLSLGMDVLSQLHLYLVFNQDKVYATAAAQPAAPK